MLGFVPVLAVHSPELRRERRYRPGAALSLVDTGSYDRSLIAVAEVSRSLLVLRVDVFWELH